MANIKISQMDETNSLNDNDLLTVVQAGKNKKIKILNTNEISISSIQPTANEKVWFKKGKNLFDKNNAQTMVGYFNSTGKIENVGNSTIILNYIKIKPNETYTISCLSQIENICFYDANGVFIKRTYTQKVTEYTFTENAYYIRLQLTTSANILDSIQIENGTIATSYEVYIEPTILVKNDAGVYEEYMNKNNLIDYSTGEKRIGTWIDGKPLYRKVVSGTVPQTSAGTDTGVNIDLASNTDMCFIEFAYFIIYGNQIRPIPFLQSTTQMTRCWYLKGSKQLRVLSSFQDASNCPIYISILYTKTTS